MSHPAQLLDTIDWGNTCLGERATWPRSLQTLLGLMMRSHRPQYLVWGPAYRFFYNAPFLPVMGIKHPGGFGQPMHEVWPEVWDEIAPLVKSCIHEGQSHYFTDRPFVLRRHGYDEETFFSFSYTPVQDDDDRFAGLMCVLSERTHELAAEKRMAEEQEKLLHLFDQAPGFLCVTSGPDHTITLVNHAYERLVGRAQDELLARSFADVQPEVVEQGYVALLDQAYASGKPFVGRAMPVQLRRDESKEADTLHVDFVYQPILDDAGTVTGILVQGADVTDRVRAESELRASEDALRRANANKDRFLAVLGHELRNPLAPIQTAAEVLRLTVGKTESAQKCLDIIMRQTRYMSALVEDVFDVARVASGRLAMNRELLDVNAIVDIAVEQMRPKIDERAHDIVVTHATGHAWVEGDKVRMTQVIGNLLANAIRYTPSGGVITVAVSVSPDTVAIEVADNGVGISADLMPDLFEMFAQANPSPNRGDGGLGLGLPLVKALVEAHGGSIAPESHGVGQGSRFVVHLPAARCG